MAKLHELLIAGLRGVKCVLHTGPMPDSAGNFTKAGTSERFCSTCATHSAHECESWESNCGGYTDYRYTCVSCRAEHWVDGIDS